MCLTLSEDGVGGCVGVMGGGDRVETWIVFFKSNKLKAKKKSQIPLSQDSHPYHAPKHKD